ncbi:MAG: dipeptidase [Vicinamibacterales bacterium]
MRKPQVFVIAAATTLIAACSAPSTPAGGSASSAATAPAATAAPPTTPADVHAAAIVIDTHDDTTQRLFYEKGFDIGARHDNGNIDIPRMREGGLDALFFSIWVPSSVTGPIAVKRAMQLIDSVHEAVRTHPNDLMLATTAADIREAAKAKKIAALMGVEGGHMIDDDLGTLRDFYRLGVRYMTLTHFQNNNWADSSTDKPKHNGLTDFGKDVVREMNRLGMMVDISHVADKTFADVIALATAPVIASHSSARAIDKHPRNMTDDMMKALAANGGVIQINFEVSFLSEENRVAQEKGGGVVAALDKMSKQCKGDEACSTLETARITREAMEKGTLPKVSWEAIVDHIDHAVKVAGVDHVGLGSDFDGATMPFGMEDASKLPKLTEALLAKGYSAADVTKILGGNLLRVMEQVEQAAARAK